MALPTVQINVRLEPDVLAFLDEYAIYLRRKRLSNVTRPDVLRYAITKLPLPQDADDQLRSAHQALSR